MMLAGRLSLRCCCGWACRSSGWRRRVAAQDERIGQLERRLNRCSRNSSAPPSSYPPGGPPTRGKGLSGRGQGAQDGHEGRGREPLSASAVNTVIEYCPERCGCGHVFVAGELVPLGERQRHQVEELPVISTVVTEYRAQRVRCPDCRERLRAVLPADVACSAFGPRFEAAVAAVSVRNRVSRRDAADLLEELFGACICTGTVNAILTRAADVKAGCADADGPVFPRRPQRTR